MFYARSLCILQRKIPQIILVLSRSRIPLFSKIREHVDQIKPVLRCILYSVQWKSHCLPFRWDRSYISNTCHSIKTSNKVLSQKLLSKSQSFFNIYRSVKSAVCIKLHINYFSCEKSMIPHISKKNVFWKKKSSMSCLFF